MNLVCLTVVIPLAQGLRDEEHVLDEDRLSR
jgi:hypothetical protein